MNNCIKGSLVANHFPNYWYWILAIAIVTVQSTSFAQPLDQGFPVTNGGIEAMDRDGNTLYVGGRFNYVGPNTGRGVLLNLDDGTFDSNFPKVNGNVYACVSDKSGGWYIGGSFTKVGNSYRSNVAHIIADGTVTNWNPGTNSIVRTIALEGSTVYLGGSFTQVGGVPRDYAAAVDASTGATTNWNPQPDGSVWSIATTNDVVYIGGSFETINPSLIPRSNLAAVNAFDGAVTSWSCDVTAYDFNLPFSVYGLMLADNDSSLYVWGNIASIGGITRRGIGRVNTYLPSSIQSWNPNVLASASVSAAGIVYAVAVSGDTVFIGGKFTRIRTTSTQRNRIAAVTRTGTPTALPWNPTIFADWYDTSVSNPPEVLSIQVSNSLVYAGGKFNLAGEQRRNNLASINRTDGQVTSWDVHVADYSTFSSANDNGVYVLQLSNDKIFAGGEFPSVNGVTRKGVAAVNLLNNTIEDWNPNLNTSWGWDPIVSAIAHYGSSVYIGGDIDSVGGQARRAFVVVDKITGLPTSFLASTTFNTLVTLLRVHDSKLYISANFTSVGDSLRSNLACIDLITEQVTSWNPQLSGSSGYESISAIAFSGSTVYLGGSFEYVRGLPRSRLAAVDNAFGIPTSWDPNNGNTTGLAAYGLEIDNSTIYLAGQFSKVGAVFRNSLAAIDANGTILPWDPNVSHSFSDARVYDIDVAGSTLYAAGDFTTINGVPRRAIAAIDLGTGSPTSWYPDPFAGEMRSLLVDQIDKNVYLGGSFYTINDDPAYCLGRYVDPSISGSSTASMRSGWNLVSVPRVPTSFARTDLFPTAVDFYSYLSGSYTTPTTLQNGEGYWALYSAATDNTISGSSLGNTSLTVPTGGRWVIIGSLTSSIAASAITTSPAGQIVGGPYAYDGTSYVLATTLEPGKAYWVLINNPCTILLN